MKTKILISHAFLLLFSSLSIYAQNGYVDWYDTQLKDYITLRETGLITIIDDSPVENKRIPAGAVFQPSASARVWVDNSQGNKIPLLFMDYQEDGIRGYVSIDDVAISQSAILPEAAINKENSPSDFFWIPSYTIDIIQSKERDTIFIYEKGRPESGYDYNPKIWYEGDPTPLVINITNTYFGFDYLAGGLNSTLIKSIKYTDSHFTLTFEVLREQYWSETTPLYFKPYAYIENLPDFYSHEPALLIFEFNAANNRMRIYNGKTKRIVFDLIKVSTGFYDKYIKFIETNKVPEDLIIPKDLLEGWPGDIKIAPLYGGANLYYTAASNLRLRSMPGTSGEIITTLKQGAKVLPLEPGLSATIDGVRAPWVWVETEDGGQGWCFSAYLDPLDEKAKEYAAATRKLKYEPPAPPPEPPASVSKQDAPEQKPAAAEREKSGLPLAALVAGGALCAAALGIILARRKKTPKS
jgi:uncharacterized protein YgiM (DUF1202 family)